MPFFMARLWSWCTVREPPVASLRMAVEFLVELLQPGSSSVIGRVLAGTVRVGDEFTEAVADEVRPVALRVVEARRYEDVLVDEVEAAFAAQLLLAGEGWDAVSIGVTLRYGV